MPIVPRSVPHSACTTPGRCSVSPSSTGWSKTVLLPGETTRSLRVLVVEDNIDAADSLSMLLRLYGHDVQVARTGPTALDIADTFGPQVVLLDIGLPGMDGYALARALRAGPLGAAIRLVALTGYGSETDKARALEAGFDEHLVKPAAIEQVLAVLERCLGPR